MSSCNLDENSSNPPAAEEGNTKEDDLPETVEVHVPAREKGPSELLYREADFDKKLLVCLCTGLLKRDGTPLIDLEKAPWCKEEKKNVKPSNADFVREVQRRKRVTAEKYLGEEKDNLFRMKPTNKTREKLIEWLTSFPIYNPMCVEFLVNEVVVLGSAG